MPRFFFHSQNGQAYRDADGVDLPDAAAAEAEALRVLGELLKDGQHGFLRDGGLSLTVADEQNLTILTLEVSLTRAAASPGRPLGAA